MALLLADVYLITTARHSQRAESGRDGLAVPATQTPEASG